MTIDKENGTNNDLRDYCEDQRYVLKLFKEVPTSAYELWRL